MGDRTIYYSVGDVADRLDVEPHRIRYWCEELDQLNPRTTPGGNRQFNDDELELLEYVRYLIDEEQLTMAGVENRIEEGEADSERASVRQTILEECRRGLEEVEDIVESM